MAKSKRKKTRRKKRKARGLTQQEKEKINSTLKNKSLKTLSLSNKYHELPSELQRKIDLSLKPYLQESEKALDKITRRVKIIKGKKELEELNQLISTYVTDLNQLNSKISDKVNFICLVAKPHLRAELLKNLKSITNIINRIYNQKKRKTLEGTGQVFDEYGRKTNFDGTELEYAIESIRKKLHTLERRDKDWEIAVNYLNEIKPLMNERELLIGSIDNIQNKKDNIIRKIILDYLKRIN